MNLQIDAALLAVAPGTRLAAVTCDGVTAGDSPPALRRLLEQATADVAARLTVAQLADIPGVAGWRQVLRTLGTDPTRYRPASEALLRRAVGGKELPSVNAMVDAGNLVSLLTGLPLGLYDLARVRGPLVLGAGQPGETYAALSGRVIETAGKPVLRDAGGVCGGPLTDSDRTKVTAGTRRVLVVIYGPPGLPVGDLYGAVDRAAALAAAHAGAVVTEQQVVG